MKTINIMALTLLLVVAITLPLWGVAIVIKFITKNLKQGGF